VSEAPSFALAYCYYCRRGTVLRLDLWAACDAPVPPPSYPPLEPAFFALVEPLLCVGSRTGGATALAWMASHHAERDRALWQA
jgi:hypothetical protein